MKGTTRQQRRHPDLGDATEKAQRIAGEIIRLRAAVAAASFIMADIAGSTPLTTTQRERVERFLEAHPAPDPAVQVAVAEHA